MKSFIRLIGFERLQHYKDRNPTWIKLYNELLDSYEYAKLSDASKAHLFGIMLLSSRLYNKIPNDPSWIAQKISAKTKINFNELIECGFLEIFQDDTEESIDPYQSASNMIQDSVSSDSLEKRREEKNREETTLSSKLDDKPSRNLKEEAKEVLQFLNEKTGRSFEAVESNLEVIVARLREPSVTVERCRSIIAKKCRDWLKDEKMSQYLRPGTLFARSKFWQYEGELIKQKQIEGVENEETVSGMQKNVLW